MTNPLLSKTFGGARVDFFTSGFSFDGLIQVRATATESLGNWSNHIMGSGRYTTGYGWSYVTYDGKYSKLTTHISAYRVCNQTNPGDSMAWRQHHQIQYADETSSVGEINPHRQTMVDIKYFAQELWDAEHELVFFFIDANQNE
jgi:hypothetical protein